MTMWAQAEILVQIKGNKCLKSGMETLSAYCFKQSNPCNFKQCIINPFPHLPKPAKIPDNSYLEIQTTKHY